MRYSVILAAVLSLVAACTPPAPPADSPPAGSADSGAAQARWQARGLRSYAYDLEVSCFCIHRGQYAVEVRNGELASVRDRATQAPAEESRVQWILTVDRLFEVMRQASQAGTPVRATYDPQLGYPAEAEIGMLANDSGTLYRITNLRPL
jgi:hypothetical protein